MTTKIFYAIYREYDYRDGRTDNVPDTLIGFYETKKLADETFDKLPNIYPKHKLVPLTMNCE